VRFLSVIYLFLRLRFVMYLSQILMSGTNSGKAVGLSRNFFPYGGSEGNQSVLRGAAPKDSLIT
jgi:hypothetical protein